MDEVQEGFRVMWVIIGLVDIVNPEDQAAYEFRVYLSRNFFTTL